MIRDRKDAPTTAPADFNPCVLDGQDETELDAITKNRDMPTAYRRIAEQRLKAVSARLRGDIARAQRHEHKIELLYDCLPKHLRW